MKPSQRPLSAPSILSRRNCSVGFAFLKRNQIVPFFLTLSCLLFKYLRMLAVSIEHENGSLPLCCGVVVGKPVSWEQWEARVV